MIIVVTVDDCNVSISFLAVSEVFKYAIALLKLCIWLCVASGDNTIPPVPAGVVLTVGLVMGVPTSPRLGILPSVP